MVDVLHAEMGGIEMIEKIKLINPDIKIITALILFGAMLEDIGLKSIGGLTIFSGICYGGYCFYKYLEKESEK